MKIYDVTRRIEWDMAHRIPLHGGKCQHLHGHRYVAEITCRGTELDEMGAVVDFGLIKQLVGGWVDKFWDHNTCYYGGDPFMEALDRAADEAWEGSVPRQAWFVMGKAPTAENLAEKLYGVANDVLRHHKIRVVSIDLWETPNCRARYEEYVLEEGTKKLPPEYNPGVMEPPSFKDPSMAGIKELFKKEKAEYDENGWQKEEGVQASPIGLGDRAILGKVFLPNTEQEKG